jgi:hypothetical protein
MMDSDEGTEGLSRRKGLAKSQSLVSSLDIFCCWADRVAQMVEDLPQKHEALSSNPNSAKKILFAD